ncbi:MAG: hypothetical protein HYX34_12955 [Actinobacteria bacterium]|nr:hypothetical protein [Actinomycetota bacterium]
MPTSSSVPVQLDRFATAASERSGALLAAARRAEDAVVSARRACPGRLPDAGAALDRTGGVASSDALLGAFCASVAAAFREADRRDRPAARPGPASGRRGSAADPAGVAALLDGGLSDLAGLGKSVLDGATGNGDVMRVAQGAVTAVLFLLRRAQVTGGAAAVLPTLTVVAADVARLVDQGNPFRAFERRGPHYLADVEMVALDAALGAFATSPNEGTAIAVVAAVAVQLDLRLADERYRAATWVVRQGHGLFDDVREGAVDGIHRATGAGRRAVRRLLEPPVPPIGVPLPSPVADRVDEVLDRVDRGADEVDAAVDAAESGVEQAVRRVGATGEKVLDGMAAAWDSAVGLLGG